MAQEFTPSEKQTAFLYGQMVQAAYQMFFHPGVDPLLPEPQGIPEGWEVGAWIHMSDFVLNFNTPEFYGIVAHELNNPDSRVIAIRGTEGWREWIDDFMARHVAFGAAAVEGHVASGFDRIYSSLKIVKRPLRGLKAAATVPERFEGTFAEQLEKEVLSREAERSGTAAVTGRERRRRPTVVAGHSLGAALATLFVAENESKKKFDVTACCTFASPRVGDEKFVRFFNRLPITSWRIVNVLDEVPKLPFEIMGYDHVATEYPFSSSGYTKNSIPCHHYLETYLHSLDPAFAVRSGCEPQPIADLGIAIPETSE
jgi:hypothetical protein